MKIVRCLWGNDPRVFEEVNEGPVSDKYKEVVIIHEDSKLALSLESRGFDVMEIPKHPSFNTPILQYNYKLEMLAYAERYISDFIYLDWDVDFTQDVEHALSFIKHMPQLQVPLYAYPKQDFKGLIEREKRKHRLDSNRVVWLDLQKELIPKYSWELSDSYVLPCFCYYRSRNINLCSILLDISLDLNLKTCVEEFAMFAYASCSLDEYIERYETPIMHGRPSTWTIWERQSQKELHALVGSKNEHLIHV